MAALVRLSDQIDGMINEIYDRKNEAEEARLLEYKAAVKVQAWFRASRVRSYIKYTNECATKVQKAWRGFLGRRFFRILLKNTVFIMKLNHYNRMACKVQKVWRGYYVRKYVFNYYSRKRYLEALQVKNQSIRNELADFAEQQQAARKREEEKNEKKRQEYEARKRHHLLSTEVMPGIYNSPFLPYPSETEYLLRSVKPLSRKKVCPKEPLFDPVCASYNSKIPTVLPPIPQKPQGPFRDPTDVQKQRYKPFQPTLRVATDFYSLEKARQQLKDAEWVTRINDNILQPFTHRLVPYEPLLHTTSKYGHLPFGTKYFREEFLDKHIIPQNFKTLVPPIPIFDKLNDTYSQGQV
ncbi:spermatogenesis-associated protein 17-like [Plakobranchus ocellatus]|uniref:Spermatogenesis-associated protein 17-like n=1 Tax=Plakobranchus ocellatus TaxID=259542 RepID=A0AAV4DVD2_9GAST|nr:spermatogenesis-associated protein 17-like [Plakobranchus ocellatus]